MDVLQEIVSKYHLVEAFAIMGALMGIARVIVAATPTPKDDKALDKVSGVLKGIAKVFGLDLKQGINKTKGITLVIMCSVLFSGCATIKGIGEDPAKQYQMTALAFTECVNVLASMKRNNALDPQDIKRADESIKLGRDVLKRWNEALKNGRSYPGVSAMAPIILKLQTLAREQK